MKKNQYRCMSCQEIRSKGVYRIWQQDTLGLLDEMNCKVCKPCSEMIDVLPRGFNDTFSLTHIVYNILLWSTDAEKRQSSN